MNLFRQIDQLGKMHKLIRENRTGNPETFAQLMGISVRRLYTIIDELRSRGAPIVYSRSMESYYYEHLFDLQLECRFVSLEERECKEINAGEKKSFFSSTAFFMQ